MKNKLVQSLLHYSVITAGIALLFYIMSNSWLTDEWWRLLVLLGGIALIDTLFHRFVKHK